MGLAKKEKNNSLDFRTIFLYILYMYLLGICGMSKKLDYDIIEILEKDISI